METEMPFLDTLVSLRNGVIAVDVYRKPTHTDRYLDSWQSTQGQHSINSPAQSPESTQFLRRKKRELSHVHAALESSGYPSKFIQDIQTEKTRSLTTNVSPEELVGMFFKMVEPTESHKSFASLPYIKGITEPLIGILKKLDVTVVNKPFTTLQQKFPNSDLRWNRRPMSCIKFPVQIVRGVILEKPAELLIPEKKNI